MYAIRSYYDNHLEQINAAVADLIVVKTSQTSYNDIINAIETLNILKQAYLDIYIPENPGAGEG